MTAASLTASRLEDLPELLAFIDATCARLGVPEDVAFAVRLSAEEVFVNIVKHGYDRKPGPVRLVLDHDGSSITLTLTDQAPPFDPRDAPAPDLGQDPADRREGGLGWHLVRQLMDEVHHRVHPDGGNVFTLVKHLGGSHEH